MAKKTKKKGVAGKFLSPANYIRKKSRNLPIYECYITSDWKESGLSHIIVSRKHSNGNLTLCIYLVDLFCLGVKDTYFRFNISTSEYDEFLEKILGDEEFVNLSYTLAHNIIFAGYEYALDYGIKAHPDFTGITIFHLEEDDDNIELIDIECGNEGKPLLIVTDDNKTKAWETVAILEKTAGKGNFHYIIGEDEFLGEEDSDDEDFDDEDFDDEDFDDEDYISDPHEKLVVILEDLEDLVYDDETQFENDKKDLKLSLESTVENLEDLEDFGILSRVYEISERIFVNEFGFDAIEKETRKFFNIFNVDIQQIPYSKETLFGSKAELISSDYIDEVNDSLVVFGEELDTKEAETDEKAADIIRAFCKKYNDVPFVQFIEVEYLNDYSATSAKKTRKKLDEYIKNSPAYIPLQLLDAQFRVGNKEDVPIIRQILEDKNLESLYSTGNITQSELFTICYCLIHHVINEKNVVMMHAIYYAMSSVFGYKEITHKYLAILMTHHFQYYIEKYGKSRL